MRGIATAVIVLGACMGPPGGGRGGGGRFGPEGPGGLGGLEPTQPRYINPGTLAALPGFTHAVRAGSTLYISGEVALEMRSEEHTSELQSLSNLVCRLPLEKKRSHRKSTNPTAS